MPPDSWPDPLPFRFLVARLLREDDLCKGGEAQARGCPLTCHVLCATCGESWETADAGSPGSGPVSSFTGPCPHCTSSSISLLRCDSCPVSLIEEARVSSPAGRLLERTLELDFDTERFSVPWDAVTCEENQALKILSQERRRREMELMKRRQEEAEQDRIRQGMQRRH